ncbi:hypothetical protein EZE58_01195 [Brevibacterium sp. LS14]|uniref:hypothetical protein n=1 Tax=Brevibacterium sp. LS14 TaxID=2528962 RepID=UPI001430E429|nr:hypothetical protein [Brevibacterium sp. LS14]
MTSVDYEFIDPRAQVAIMPGGGSAHLTPDGFTPWTWEGKLRDHPERIVRLYFRGILVCLAHIEREIIYGDNHPAAPKIGPALVLVQIETHAGHRREGHAARMFQELQAAYPGKPIVGFSENDEAWDQFRLTELYPGIDDNHRKMLIYTPSFPRPEDSIDTDMLN